MSLALALAGGAVAATAASSTPALAQRQQQTQAPTLSKDFQKVYEPFAASVNTTPNYDAARSQIPALLAAVKSDYDRFFAGSIITQLGAKTQDRALQKQGLQLMLASGQGSPADVGLFNYLLGAMEFDERNYAAARQHGQASLAAGFQGNFAEQQDPWSLIVDSYAAEGNGQEGAAFIKKTIADRRAAGQEVREIWILRPLAMAYEKKQADEAADWAALLVAQNPSRENWQKVLQVVGALSPADVQLRLDLLRLMALTNSMTDRREYEAYVDAADARIMSNEVGRVLDAGVQAGVFTTGDPFYVETKRLVDERAAADRSEAPGLAAEARQASTGSAARSAGNLYLSLADYPAAEEMFKLAVAKGGVDRDQVLTRLGIAQVQQGKYAEARATLAQVTGPRAPLAEMWSAYAQSKG
jgi:tetratricopeptide (TPR) repeat protein